MDHKSKSKQMHPHFLEVRTDFNCSFLHVSRSESGNQLRLLRTRAVDLRLQEAVTHC